MCNNLFVNKYQPRYFNEFQNNKSTITLLQSMIQIDKFNIMLSGEITSGKTTMLNAFIREYYNDIPYAKYTENILYINNLKEQGINYFRTDVKTFCQTFSTIKGKKKLIILDDIDLINEQSQQVFRNFIDKFSNNVCFISTCSNIQKVIESLQSRFTIIKIEPLDKIQINNIINHIKKNENIVINDEAQQFIINISNNTIKVIINYLEKFKLLNLPITIDIANIVCSNISYIILEQYTMCILQNNMIKAIQIINELYQKGYSVMDILDNYFSFVKSTNILSEDQKYIIIPYICKYIAIFHNIHEDEIELSLFTNNLINQLVAK